MSPLPNEAPVKVPPANHADQTTSLLFELPAEIRNEIYSYCIPRKCAIKVTASRYRPWGVQPVVSTRDPSLYHDKFSNTRPRWTNILHVCKQMSEECLDILYGENLFEVYLSKGAETMLKKTFSKRNLQRIRYVLAVAPSRWFSGTLRPPDCHFWSMIIPNLMLFEWVTQPDWRSRRHCEKPVPEQQLMEWFEWTDTYLQCFSECMPAGARFKMGLDDGDGDYRKVGGVTYWRGPFFKKGGEVLKT